MAKLEEEAQGAGLTRKEFLLGGGALIIGFSTVAGLVSNAAFAASPPAAPPSWVDPVQPGMDAAAHAAAYLKPTSTVGQYIAVTHSGHILVTQSQPDVGTGATTGMAQIVAEELYVPLDAVVMVGPDSLTSGNTGGVGGSMGVQSSGAMLRLAAASARESLRSLAAGKLGVSGRSLTVKNGAFYARSGKSVTYAELVAGKTIQGAVDPNVTLKPVSEYTIVGRSVPRLGIPTKVTGGSGTFDYAANIRVPGMVHARWLKPPAYGATIVSYDDREVLKMPGIVAVVPIDFTRIGLPGYDATENMESFQGLAVVAEQEYQAIVGVEALAKKTVWSGAPALGGSWSDFSYLKALPEYSLQTILSQGSMTKGFSEAAKTYSRTYTTPYLANAPIGPSVAVADVQPGKVQVWTACQNIWTVQAQVADLLGVSPSTVEIISYSGSGVYGRGLSPDVPYEAVLLSRAVGRPVRVQWMRQEEFQWSSCMGPKVLTLRAGLNKGGRVTAMQFDVWTDNDVPGNGFNGQQFIAMTPRYEFPHLLERVHYVSNPLRKGLLRAVGGPSNSFAYESMMDELAYEVHADPVAYRLAHLTDARQIAVLKAAAKGIGWTPHTRPSGRGIGIAAFVDSVANTYVAKAAEVKVDKSTGKVKVTRIVMALDCGLEVNPKAIELQMEGGTLQSLSWCMKEQLKYDSGMITTVDWESYPILTFSEVPEIETILINNPQYAPSGVGEPPTLGTAAMVANAIYDASGARLRSWPFTPENVLRALKSV